MAVTTAMPAQSSVVHIRVMRAILFWGFSVAPGAFFFVFVLFVCLFSLCMSVRNSLKSVCAHLACMRLCPWCCCVLASFLAQRRRAPRTFQGWQRSAHGCLTVVCAPLVVKLGGGLWETAQPPALALASGRSLFRPVSLWTVGLCVRVPCGGWFYSVCWLGAACAHTRWIVPGDCAPSQVSPVQDGSITYLNGSQSFRSVAQIHCTAHDAVPMRAYCSPRGVCCWMQCSQQRAPYWFPCGIPPPIHSQHGDLPS